MLKPGHYEQVINRLIAKELSESDVISKTLPIDNAESSKIFARYAAEVIERGLEYIKDHSDDLNQQVELVNRLVAAIVAETGEHISQNFLVDQKAEQLIAIFNKTNSIHALYKNTDLVRPETSIAISSLFTGAIYEPSMVSEIKKEIMSCDRIDMLVSFIKWSGLRLIIDELRNFTSNGGKLRIITTSYMGATDIKAIRELNQLEKTEIRISYNTRSTRLHAKTYVFYRDSGFTTAYVGSSNLSNAAITSGLEWNVKLASKDQPETIKKIEATFESYWNSNDFEYFSEEQSKRLEIALNAERHNNDYPAGQYLFDIHPYSYQEEILDQLDAEREVHGHFKNLIVAATGTGKTVISAFDYKRFCKGRMNRPNRLLFVAHREEILRQSLDCFRGVLRDANFGELFAGSSRPQTIDHLFVSVQTYNSQFLHEKTTSDFYDYIIIDEFHHAAAPTYQKLLSHYHPQILLGLTATPERMDGQSVVGYFDHRIAAEIRLPEAIDRKLLSPFHYFGVTDTVDLNTLRWVRGGYEKSELSRVYALDYVVARRRADWIVKSTYKYVTDINEVKAIGFCVSVDHARFMADFFNECGIPSIHLSGQTEKNERKTAKDRLVKGDIRCIFVVDIYNEGIDIPEINTVLFLRPTESLTVFLQQLGRGLRLSDEKECLTVLDFIGQANKNYNFQDRFKALMSNTTRSLLREIKDGFVSLPKGCNIQLERKAQKYILENIKSSLNMKSGLITRIANFEEESGQKLALGTFVDYYHLDVRTLYARKNSFARLCVLAGVSNDFNEPFENSLSSALPRLCSINSRRWISFLISALSDPKNVDNTPDNKRMLNMLHYTIWQKSPEECGFESANDSLHQLRENPVLCSELITLLRYNYEKIDFIDTHLSLGFDCPLDIHCNYTRDQILIAFDFNKPSSLREGIKYFPEKKCDLLFVTLNKSDKDYSPTTMYNDYSINEWLFHWQSQSTTSDHTTTGQRYINHRKTDNHVLLFVREYKNDNAGAAPYTFLGLADYLSHQGSRPMSITWKLQSPIPAKFLKKTNKLVVG